MHLSEGVLSAPVLIGGACFAAVGVYKGLKELNDGNIIMTGVLSAAFFVASLVHVPVGFGNAHLLLCGLTGVILGWSAFPAILVALALQAILFQYGGITTIGVNTFTMGSAAVFAYYIFKAGSRCFKWKYALRAGAFLGGFMGVAIAALFTALALAFTSEGFIAAAEALLLAHIPVMFAEGLITMFTVGIIARVKPELIGLRNAAAAKITPSQKVAA